MTEVRKTVGVIDWCSNVKSVHYLNFSAVLCVSRRALRSKKIIRRRDRRDRRDTQRTAELRFLCKLIAGIKLRLLRRVGDAAADRERDLSLLDHAPIIPRVAHLVRRLMIVRGVVCLELFFAPLLRVAHVIISLFQTDRRHARFRKRKMIRAEERSLLRS